MKSKNLAKISIVLAISSIYIHLFGLLETISILFGIIALKENDMEEKDKERCKIAIIISALNILMTIVIIIIFSISYAEQFEYILSLLKNYRPVISPLKYTI